MKYPTRRFRGSTWVGWVNKALHPLRCCLIGCVDTDSQTLISWRLAIGISKDDPGRARLFVIWELYK